MPLSLERSDTLLSAINAYAFPSAFFDFTTQTPHVFPSPKHVESRVLQQLKSETPSDIKDGLSNVLYWGWAQNAGLQAIRVQRFRASINEAKLDQAARLFRERCPSVLDIRAVELPEFSGLSFVSKIRMFLDPDFSVVLDRQILKMNDYCGDTVLSGISIGKESTIRITKRHARVYEAWCQRLSSISRLYPEHQLRPVDIERGFFHLIQTGRAELAASILRDA